jgi:hypothetical protein
LQWAQLDSDYVSSTTFFLKRIFLKKRITKKDPELKIDTYGLLPPGGRAVFKNRSPTGRFFFFFFFFYFVGRKDLVVKKITNWSLGKTARPGGGFSAKTVRWAGGFWKKKILFFLFFLLFYFFYFFLKKGKPDEKIKNPLQNKQVYEAYK